MTSDHCPPGIGRIFCPRCRTATTPRDHHRLLVRALLGQHHEEQYLTDATFKATIDDFARLLPAMVDGIAMHARRESATREAKFQEQFLNRW